jgi:poly-gamma-glutamate capsule biosynthesis protein CapA/YwtB (metallophosphatase superfamily)
MKTFFFFSFLIAACGSGNNKPAATEPLTAQVIPGSETTSTAPLKPSKDTLVLTCVGDMMLGTNYPAVATYLPPNEGKDLLKEMVPFLQKADITFGNLEGTLFDKGGSPKACGNPGSCFAFRMPAYLGNVIKAAGFDVVSVANNHVGDFGDEGRRQTIANLDKLGIQYAGQVNYPTTIVEAKGIKLGIVAVAPNNNCVKLNDYTTVKKYIAELRKKCHLVMVSFHGGAEGRDRTRVPRKTEIFVGENRGNVYEFAHAMVDAGADMVIGHGPHVTRAFDFYKGKFIAYSLGNFCTWERMSIDGVSGIAPLLTLQITGEGKFVQAQITPTKQIGQGVPVVDDSKWVIKELQKLTAADCKEANITISDEGLVTEKK